MVPLTGDLSPSTWQKSGALGAAMEVRVKLYAGLTRSAGVSGQVVAIDLPEGSTVADLVAALDLAPGQARLTFVNGRARRPHHRLAPGDQVGVFPPIGGG